MLWSICWLSRAVAPDAPRKGAVKLEGSKPGGLFKARQTSRRRAVMVEEGKGQSKGPMA